VKAPFSQEKDFLMAEIKYQMARGQLPSGLSHEIGEISLNSSLKVLEQLTHASQETLCSSVKRFVSGR
jgi:hypothetical protein